MHLHCKVEFAFVWNIHAIYRKKPDIVLLPNTVGSQWYFEISQYAAQQGIKVFALISEGNFRTNGSFQLLGLQYRQEVFIRNIFVIGRSEPEIF
jgi:hypothetical protein